MASSTKKLQIVESLQSLDQSQVEQVLMYIRGLSRVRSDEDRSLRQKQDAMIQIRQALRKDRFVTGF